MQLKKIKVDKDRKMKNYLTFAILLELSKHEYIPAKNLADKFEISTRSVYRYLNELESAGIPTFTKIGKNGGIGIKKTFALESLTLNDQDKDFLTNVINALNIEGTKKDYFKDKLGL